MIVTIICLFSILGIITIRIKNFYSKNYISKDTVSNENKLIDNTSWDDNKVHTESNFE